MLTVSCPSCGAPAAFRSHASVMAVCEYCRTTVLKDVGATEQLGKLSDVLEDYSPIQIGTAGVAGTRTFTVIGRIQLRYEHGVWNEWYLQYDDGQNGWLGDASGQYTLTTVLAASAPLPAFEEIVPGKLYTIEGERFTAADRRSARCIGGQGELPFKVGDGWEARVADLRAGKRFLTLDYSDAGADGTAQLYSGQAVSLAELKCQLLRDDDTIKASAGRYRGKLDALDCPACGGAIRYVPGATANLVCPSCSAQLDASGPQATVLAAGERVEAARLSLELGASATINGAAQTVIGAMIRSDDEGERWTEYLVFGARSGFFWLIDAGGDWYRSTVLDEWPQWHWTGSDNATLAGVAYDKSTEYPARVEFAAGAFNWRVSAGDTVRVFEFEHGNTSLSAELTDEELSWSRSTPLAHDQVQAWFGKALRSEAAPVRPKAAASARSSGPVKFMWWILALNAIPLLFNFFSTAIILVVALIAIFYPPAAFSNDESSEP